MTISIISQSVLDGLLLSLSSLGLLGRSRGKLDWLLPLVFAGIFVMRFAFYMMHMTYGISL